MNKKISIINITFAGMFLAIYVIFERFINFSVGTTNISFDFAFFVMYGIIFGPWFGSFLAILSDTFSLLVRGKIGFWMWEYQLMPILITLVACLFKYLFSKKFNLKVWWTSILSIFIITDLVALSLLSINSHFAFKNLNIENNITNILIWISIAFLISLQIILGLLFYFKKHEWIKEILSLFAIFSFVIVIFSWIWGPIAFTRYLNHISSQVHTLKGKYLLFLIPRLGKTPIQLLLWTSITYAIYNVYNIISKNKKNFY